jgi:hypothetical protein
MQWPSPLSLRENWLSWTLLAIDGLLLMKESIQNICFHMLFQDGETSAF